MTKNEILNYLSQVGCVNLKVVPPKRVYMYISVVVHGVSVTWTQEIRLHIYGVTTVIFENLSLFLVTIHL